jgi:protein-S-isoprenylcysteine O-methyltransferase Ste14
LRQSASTTLDAERYARREVTMHALELKVPPVAVVLFMAALMWLVARAVPVFEIALPARGFLAIGLAVTGMVASLSGVVSFRRANTTVNPMKPDSSSSLVSSGVYALTRNPMYLGFLLVLAGWAVFLSNMLGLLLLPVFVFYMNRFQIEPEEKALAILFGPAFIAYQSRVRRWL